MTVVPMRQLLRNITWWFVTREAAAQVHEWGGGPHTVVRHAIKESIHFAIEHEMDIELMIRGAVQQCYFESDDDGRAKLQKLYDDLHPELTRA